MRRLLTMTALSGALLLGACSSGSSDSPASPAAAPAPSSTSADGAVPAPAAAPGGATSAAATASRGASSGGDAALRDDTRAICAQASRLGAEAGKNFAGDLRLLIDAESAQDPSAAARVREKTTRDVQNYSSALVDMAGLASDPELKKALSQMAKQVSAIEGDVRKMDADKLAGLQDDLTAVCGAN